MPQWKSVLLILLLSLAVGCRPEPEAPPPEVPQAGPAVDPDSPPEGEAPALPPQSE